MSDHFNGPERRAKPPSVTRYEVEQIIADHEVVERQNLREEIEQVLRAFPDGIDGHRAAHERMMKAAEAEEQFWRGLREDVAKKSIWGVLQVLLFLAVAGLAAKFGLALPVSK